MKPSIQFVERKEGVKLAYSIFGQGPTLLHPAPWVTNLAFFLEDKVSLKFWMTLANHFTVVLYDKHGCGQSDRDRKEFTLESDLFDLTTVIDALGLNKFILFGISAAGPLTVEYTVRHPGKVTSLILYGTFVRGKDTAKEDVRSALVNLIKSAWGLGSRAITDIFIPGATKEVHDVYAKFQREACSAEIASKLMELNYMHDVTDLLSEIKVPTLVLHREGDKIAPLAQGRQMAMGIPDARFKVFKGNIHLPWLGDTSGIIQEILEFTGEDKLSISSDNKQVLTNEDSDVVEQTSILFTDISSSTDLVTEKGDATARNIFLQHDKIIRDQVRKYGGKELQNLGDGFMLSFPSASQAISCACSIQRIMSDDLPFLRIRIGINSGEVVHREGEHPFGQAVVMASRILSRCKGGQILVSDVTKQLTAGSKFSFVERGAFKAKGFKDSIKLYEVVPAEQETQRF
jgi:class 3 adenylate cyclase/pimeloyl-ACP methyl ester carboxylesterase